MSYNYSKVEPRPEEIRSDTALKLLHQTVEPVEERRESPDHCPQISRSRTLWTLLRGWEWELATWLLGSCALFSIIALLLKFSDGPLNDWTLDIRLATVIAALSQISQSALLVSVSACIGQLKWEWLRTKHPASDLREFEEASRGPRGSLMLLPRTQLHLVSVGALATILLLAFSPFTQQSVTIRVRSVNYTSVSTNASIGRAVQYMDVGWDNNLIPYPSQPLFNTSKMGPSVFHPHMFKAVLSGMLNNNKTVSDVQGNCSAEACKWDNYTTLAICNTVEEIPSGLEFRNNTLRISGVPWEPPQQGGGDVLDTFWMTAPFSMNSSTIEDEHLPPFADMFIAYFTQCNEQNRTREDLSWVEDRKVPSNWKAHKASLSLCLQTLKSTFNNTMETTVVETHRNLKWVQTETVMEDGDTFIICLAEPYENLEFCVGKDDLIQWSGAIQKIWEGAGLLWKNADNYYTGQWVPNIIGDIFGPAPAICNPNLGPGYGFEGFQRRINNIAISMSNALRTGNTTSPDSFIKGTEWNREQYIEVNFAWLILPGAVYLIITLFFLATVVKSRRGDRPLWKSSPLVLLQVADRNNGMNTLKRVEKEADCTQVQLKYTGENWHLQNMAR